RPARAGRPAGRHGDRPHLSLGNGILPPARRPHPREPPSFPRGGTGRASRTNYLDPLLHPARVRPRVCRVLLARLLSRPLLAPAPAVPGWRLRAAGTAGGDGRLARRPPRRPPLH